MTTDEFFLLKSLEYRASKLIYSRYGMNRFELQMLCSLVSYLMLHEKKVVSRKSLCDWLGMSIVLEKKSYGYIEGLSRLGAIHVFTWRNQKPGTGNSIALAPFGARVLATFWNELERLEGIELSQTDYTGIMTVTAPEGYTARQLGRTA